ncbi:MAG TPA: AI-2E family transporter [Symbiobacteriaceae bacterium]|jgi:predicted PurR-regulated permease PerM
MVGQARRWVAALVLGGLVLATGWGLWAIRPVLAPFLLAIGIAYIIAPLVNGLARRGMSRGWAIVTVYAMLAASLALVVVKVLPQVVEETRRLAEAIPAYSLMAREWVDSLQQRVREMGVHPGIRDVLNRLITDVEIGSVRALEQLLDVSTLRRAAGLLASLLLAPFLAFYLLKDMERFKERFVRSLPGRYRQELLALLRGLDRVLSGFVRGQILLALAVGLLASIATWLLGLRYTVLLGIWAGSTEFIPYIGPVLGAMPAVLAGLSVSPLTGLETTLAFLFIQQIENAILSPKIMGDSVGLHPLVVLFVVLAGGYVAGPWGLVLALPLTGLARVVWCFIVARLTEAPAGAATPAPALRPERHAPAPKK